MSVPDPLTPLSVRPGARFTCHGDGLCCADIHAFGPLSDDESAWLTAIHPSVVIEHRGERLITMSAERRCVFRQRGRCELHASLGPDVKPSTCRQFPFLFVATPAGGRVVTEHCCPCRTMGERAPLTVDSAVAHVGAVRVDRRVSDPLPLARGVSASMAEWMESERSLFERLGSGDDPLDVLEAEPLAPPDRWRTLGTSLVADDKISRFSAAMRRFGRDLLALLGEDVTNVDHELGWADAFDRAESRSTQPEDPEAMLRDWVADAIWSLEWVFVGTFAQARAELATRVTVARRIAGDLEREGTRPDRAMAEAITVVELTGCSSAYQALVGQLPEG